MFENVELISWIWDDSTNTLVPVDKNGDRIIKKATSLPSSISRGSPARSIQHLKLGFLEAVDHFEQVQFRRHFMRKSKQDEMDVVILQDIKDVVFYLLLTPVPTEFICFFHTVEVDNFLRGLILYFQYFLEIWEDVQYRCQNVTKLKHPIGVEREMVVTENLSQLRCIVARDYFLILIGAGSCKRFHHMSNKQNKSIGDRDLRLFEHLFLFSTRVVWIALWRNNMSIIEHEMNRLLRSDHYSLMSDKTFPDMQFTGEEGESNKQVLYGDTKKEGKLLVQSPLFHEVSKDHPTELLQLGLSSVPPRNENLLNLYDSYTLPEEYLEENGFSVGILGHSRASYEPLLQPKETIIETVKRYTIKSGLPRIFPGRITSTVEKSSVDTFSYLSNVSPSKEVEKVPSPIYSSKGNSEEEVVQVIVRSKEFYIDLHKKRRLYSLKMWKTHRSVSSHLKLKSYKAEKAA